MIKLKGIGHKYLSLLSQANISTVEELRKLEPESLERTLAAVNARYQIVKQLPSRRMIKDWIRQARRARPGPLVVGELASVEGSVVADAPADEVDTAPEMEMGLLGGDEDKPPR
jgi:hypothetical protein